MEIDELKVFLNVSEEDDTLDEILESLYALSKKIFTQYTRVNLESDIFTDKFVGFSGTVIYPHNTPITSVTTINSYPTFGADAVEITEYQILNDTIYLHSSITSAYIEVTYKAGYSTIPTEIDQVLVQIISFLWTYNDKKVFLSSNGEAILEPDEVKIPKHVRDSMAIYRIGL